MHDLSSDKEYLTFLNKAYRYAAYKEVSSFCILKKLNDWQCPTNYKDFIIEQLLNEDYVNDERYIRLFVKSKFNLQKWGKRKIVNALLIKGFNTCQIAPFLDNIDEQYIDVLKNIIVRKMSELNKKEKKPLILKQKIIRFCLSKGYEMESINNALKQLI